VADRLTGETRNGTLRDYSYNATDELLGDGVDTFDYDLAGNRNTTGYVTGPKNQYLSDGVFNYFYDNEGNLAEKRLIGTDEKWLFAYDHNNQLVQVEYLDDTTLLLTVAFRYDVFQNRIEKTVDAAVERYAYDGLHVWADLDGSSSLTTRRIFGDQVDQVLARITGSTVSWYLTDRLGSIREIANNTTGAFIDEVTYGGFGNIESETTPANGDRYKYTGREFFVEIGLYDYRLRTYDAIIGRFNQEDPLFMTDVNPYRYVGNQPTGFTDPSGLVALAASPDALMDLPQGYNQGIDRWWNGLSAEQQGDFNRKLGAVQPMLANPGDAGGSYYTVATLQQQMLLDAARDSIETVLGEQSLFGGDLPPMLVSSEGSPTAAQMLTGLDGPPVFDTTSGIPLLLLPSSNPLLPSSSVPWQFSNLPDYGGLPMLSPSPRLNLFGQGPMPSGFNWFNGNRAQLVLNQLPTLRKKLAQQHRDMAQQLKQFRQAMTAEDDLVGEIEQARGPGGPGVQVYLDRLRTSQDPRDREKYFLFLQRSHRQPLWTLMMLYLPAPRKADLNMQFFEWGIGTLSGFGDREAPGRQATSLFASFLGWHQHALGVGALLLEGKPREAIEADAAYALGVWTDNFLLSTPASIEKKKWSVMANLLESLTGRTISDAEVTAMEGTDNQGLTFTRLRAWMEQLGNNLNPEHFQLGRETAPFVNFAAGVAIDVATAFLPTPKGLTNLLSKIPGASRFIRIADNLADASPRKQPLLKRGLRKGGLPENEITRTSDIIKGLKGTTKDAKEIARAIQRGEIKVRILERSKFTKTFRKAGGKTPIRQVTAFNVADTIYLRKGSPTLLSDVIHEGTHALDDLRGYRGTSWQWEKRAYFAERRFQLATGRPVTFPNWRDVYRHIRKNYPWTREY
jgi:RHS repeat-associated protein